VFSFLNIDEKRELDELKKEKLNLAYIFQCQSILEGKSTNAHSAVVRHVKSFNDEMGLGFINQNLVKCHGYFKDWKSFYNIFEFIQGGSFTRLIR
jgi:hypothetical protein